MKVIQVVTQMEAGGAQQVAISLANGLSQKGYDSKICYLYKKRDIDTNTVKTDILFNQKPTNILHYIYIIYKLLYMIMKEKPDILISHTHYSNVLCHIFSRIFEIPKRIAVQHNPKSSYPFFVRTLDTILGENGFYHCF